MKTDVLLFTQTMHSLLSSHLSLQNALEVCSRILSDKKGKVFIKNILKKVSEGEKLSAALTDYKKDFSPLYISLVSIGEESGNLTEVFGHLSSYLKVKKNMRNKIVQALLYPAMVLVTAVAVVIILTVFVMPHLEGIFEAFSTASTDIADQMQKTKTHLMMLVFFAVAVVILIVLCLVLRKVNKRFALVIDGALLKVPVIGKLIVTMQMNDFSFAMKLFTSSHFSLVKALEEAKKVPGNREFEKAVESACRKISGGMRAGRAFESEKVFPEYFTAWVKIAEENGDAQRAFGEITDFYRNENENMLAGITQAAEPVFILITGIIIIFVIVQFVIPVFNLLGAL